MRCILKRPIESKTIAVNFAFTDLGRKMTLHLLMPSKTGSFHRATLPVNTAVKVVVFHVKNPYKMYLSPINDIDTFSEIVEFCQDVESVTITPSPGLVCLSFTEECWYRVEVDKVSHGTIWDIFQYIFIMWLKPVFSSLSLRLRFLDLKRSWLGREVWSDWEVWLL